MVKYSVRILVFTLAVSLIVVMFAGCTGSVDGSAGSSSASSSAASEPSDAEPEETVIPLTALVRENASEHAKVNSQYYPIYIQRIRELFGIDYSIQTVLASEMKTVVNTLLASGQELPDMIQFDFSAHELQQAYENGKIIELNDLIYQNAPNIKAAFDSIGKFFATHSNADGTILRIQGSYSENAMGVTNMLHFNYGHMEKIGLGSYPDDYPTTTDDLLETLSRLRSEDANGDGAANEVLTAMNSEEITKILGSAFGVHYMRAAQYSFWPDADGNIRHEMLTEEAKSLISYMNRLYQTGVLDNDYIGQSSDSYWEKINNNKVSVAVGPYWISTWYTSIMWSQGHTGSGYVAVQPVVSDGFSPFCVLTEGTGSLCFMVTADCEYPEKAVEMLNYGYSNEGSRLMQWGPDESLMARVPEAEQKEWGLNLGDEPLKWTDHALEQINAMGEAVFYEYVGIQSSIFPFLAVWNDDQITYNLASNDSGDLSHDIGVIQGTMIRMADLNDWGVADLYLAPPTAQQVSDWERFSDLWTFMTENIDQFIAGIRPMDEWDEFVAACEEQGVGDAVAIIQERYDRYLKMVG